METAGASAGLAGALSRVRATIVGRRRLALVLVALGLGGAVWLLIGQAVGSEEIARALERADLRWLQLCLVGEIASYFGYVLAYRETARVAGGPDLPLGLAARVIALGFGGTALASTPGGLAVDYWALHEAGASRADAVTRVLALNTAKWLALGLAAAGAGVAVASGAVGGPTAMAYGWLAVVGGSIALAAWVSTSTRARRWTAGISADPGLLRGMLADAIGGVVYVRRLVAEPLRNVGALVGFPLYWFGDLACLYGGLRSFGVHPSLVPLILGYATGYAATGLPLPLGGSGGVEAAMTYALHSVGIPLAAALLGVGVYRLFGFWLPLLVAGATVPTLGGLGASLARVRRIPAER